MKIINMGIFVYAALVSVMILRTVMTMAVVPKAPASSPVPALSVSSLESARKVLDTRLPSAATPSGSAVEFGKPEPFK